ncbi:hypothetical protein A3K55_01290 [Candidatus Shapirobacteria bacterium RBG_13_44_7]|uniref:Ferredoxin n=1 Tax=Candidatus Shapirobacteria bacterium RBG_13_44_7 TaxID=1802149 RepID=A0A1F7SKE8_9BACT|nr:MAG: hypothetical protein A3K55_01290 [Candidatus Shapirobacteria bacterium RBG_13_44_7]
MPKKIVIVDQDKCIGCNTCPLVAPETFELDQKTFKAFVKKQPDSITKEIETAVSSCPVGAISIVEE